MERNERCTKQINLIVALLLTLPIQAGCIFSKCRRPVRIHPQPIEYPVHDRVEKREFVLQAPANSTLRRERIKRHVKFVMKRHWEDTRQRNTSS